MQLNFNSAIDLKELFLALYNSKTEEDVEDLIKKHPDFFQNQNWVPVGGNDSNYGIIENQQSNPIAALVEKVTNSIDAILTKKCIENILMRYFSILICKRQANELEVTNSRITYRRKTTDYQIKYTTY